jgi:hypothetical protein
MNRLRLVILAGLLCNAAVAHATVIVPADLPELVTDATAIVRGRVVAAEAQRAEGQRAIETVVTIEADEYLKGNLGDRITIRVPGGQIGTQRSVLIGAPIFRLGDEVVLFLGSRPPAVPWILGLNQGVYRVRTEQRVGAQDNESEHRTVVRGRLSSRTITSVRGIPLEAFRARVRALTQKEEGQ